MVHDEAMKVLESEIGQNAKELADALFRTTMADGTNCLTALHKGGWLKKVPTNQVIVTPTAKSTCRLDELNNLLKKIEDGGDAAAALADMDKNRGIRGANPSVKEGREVGTPASLATRSSDMFGDVAPTTVDVLTDDVLSQQRLDQATKMEAEAKSLLAEAKRLKQEATQLSQPKAKNVGKTSKKAAA
jgi:hypothetical protein